MLDTPNSKIRPTHLQRDAWLYIRQSSLHQVVNNTESTARQYALRQRAVALGWSYESVHVIDIDQGHSGAEKDRVGFAELMTQVSLGQAGIVMGLEVSRLARNSTDWHRLLEICALSDTLILDEDGVYDPGHFNDRLLLGLKGTMSEAELHVLRARLQGGILNAARRGELKLSLPVGLVYDELGRVVLDPDRQVQGAVRLLFDTFTRTGSASATVKTLQAQEVSFPRRPGRGPSKGQLLWGPVYHHTVLRLLHNPRYAGAFAFGRSRNFKNAQGHYVCQKLKREDWQILIPDAHEGYISWDDYEANQKRLRGNAQAHGSERRAGPPREGLALLQGLVMCAKCGQRMTVRYVSRKGGLEPHYVCQRDGIDNAKPICQNIPGKTIDTAIGNLLLELITPLQLNLALAVEVELRARFEEADKLRMQQVERVRQEAELARRRYLRVDPDNRLVADELEQQWNEKLRALQTAQQEYEHKSQTDARCLDEEQRKQIRALAEDFPRLWNDPATPQRERKRLVRLLLEDVTLLKEQQTLRVQIRLSGGAVRTLSLPKPLRSWEEWQTDPKVIAEIDKLLDGHIEREVAEILNARGFTSGQKQPFTARIIAKLIKSYDLKSRYQRLRDMGLLTQAELAEKLNVCPKTLRQWRAQGRLIGYAYSDRGGYLYQLPESSDTPVKYKQQRSRSQH